MMKKSLANWQNSSRTNTKIISSTSEPVYTVSITNAADAARKGVLYSVNLDPGTLNAKTSGTDGIIAICLSNPEDSGKVLYLNRVMHGLVVTGTEDNSIDLDILKDGNWTGTGTLTAYNRNFSYTDRGAMTINYVHATNTNPLSSGTLISTRRTGASTAQVILEIAGEIIVPPAHSCTIKVSNASSKSAISSLSIVWWEC
jgi:hypothetical protein